MIRNTLDDIINMNIEIATPGASDESFSNILMVVEAPTGEGIRTIGNSVIAISKADELKDYGYTLDSQAYIMATVAYSQSPEPDTIYMIVRSQQIDDTGETKEDSSGNILYETMADTLSRANEAGDWYGIGLSKNFLNKIDIEDTIKWTETHKKLFGFTFAEDELPVDTTNYFRSFAAYCGGVPDVEKIPDENYYITIAMMSKCFGYNPGSETWALKTLAALYPCKLSISMKNYCDNNNITYFTTYANKNITSAKGGKVLGNEWIDTIRFRDWLQNDMQERIFNLLVSNPKVPYTDAGITAIEGKIEESLKTGQDVGGIVMTEYDNDDNEIPGYTITVPKSLNLTDVQRASRQLQGCKFKAKIAGAIQVVEVSGNLVYA